MVLPGDYPEPIVLPFAMDVIGRVKGKVRFCPPSPDPAVALEQEQEEDERFHRRRHRSKRGRGSGKRGGDKQQQKHQNQHWCMSSCAPEFSLS